jgi:hypothetical protein
MVAEYVAFLFVSTLCVIAEEFFYVVAKIYVADVVNCLTSSDHPDDTAFPPTIRGSRCGSCLHLCM